MVMPKFQLNSLYPPRGDQPKAIKALADGYKKFDRQTLLGVTGSGKTFTIANIIQRIQKPTLVFSHNKTLAAQLYQEFKTFFPNNKVCYFISYYDYYQPESYIPHSDTYIEKDADVNEKIEQMRLGAATSLLSRDDVIIVSSVSCIYGFGQPADFEGESFKAKVGQRIDRNELLKSLIAIQYERNDTDLAAGRFRAKGDTVDIVQGWGGNIVRIELDDDVIEGISELHPISGKKQISLSQALIYPARPYVVPSERVPQALKSIREELTGRLPKLGTVESYRLNQRTNYDLEMIEQLGYCKGIENYSRHFDGRKSGEPPYTLMDYFSDDSLIIIDESHQTIPQIHGMYKGDKARKKNLIDFGFRLPSAYDNRPLKFDEFEKIMDRRQTIFVSATPSEYEKENSSRRVEQIIRPTGLVDPEVFVKPLDNQVEDVKIEIDKAIKKGHRILVTTLTKRLAEELTEYLAESGIKTRYLHSEIDTLERTEIIRQLRLGEFDVLVGINLLREGIDIPEVGFVGILDADKEGFLRNDKSLIQTIGRAARNSEAKVILYANNMTDSIKKAMDETNRRRKIQEDYNKKYNIEPKTIIKPIKEKEIDVKDIKHIPKKEIPNILIELEAEMRDMAEKLEFEKAINIRNRMKKLKEKIGMKDFD